MEPADEGRLNINLQRRRTQAAVALLNADEDGDDMELTIPVHVRPGETSPNQRRSRGNLLANGNESALQKEPLPNLGNAFGHPNDRAHGTAVVLICMF